MVPPAPSLFSITTVWPRVLDIDAPSVRATVSVGPPAADGTTIVSGRVGYPCPSAAGAQPASAITHAVTIAAKLLFILIASLLRWERSCVFLRPASHPNLPARARRRSAAPPAPAAARRGARR